MEAWRKVDLDGEEDFDLLASHALTFIGCQATLYEFESQEL
jgi:hypothetical protein